MRNKGWKNNPDHPYWMLITSGSVSGKKMCYLILINHHPNIDKIYLYAINPYQPKYQVLINKRQQTGQIIL